MSTQIDISVDTRLVYIRFVGLLSNEIALAVDDELRTLPDFRADFDLIVDLREAQSQSLTPAAIQELIKRPALFSKGTQRAIVVSNDLNFGLGRIFESMRDFSAGEIRVFRDIGDAYEWLDRKMPDE